MHSLSYYRAYSGEKEKIIELPYEDDKTSMVIILPNKMEEYELTNEMYNGLTSRLYQQKVNLNLVKFTFETPTFELKPLLKKLGLTSAFENYADFSGMRKEKDLKIGTALHKAKIIVNEEGTEAAAVTVIGMVKTTSVSIPPPIMKFTVDKPFYYFIKDNTTNTILFMGRMNAM
jgi:serpin B